MKQLTLENIAWYFPNELKVFSEIHKRIDLVVGMGYVHTGKPRLNLKMDNNCTYINGLESVKPILLPMSDLKKTFIKYGEETTHLQELAKIAFGHREFVLDYSTKNQICAKRREKYFWVFNNNFFAMYEDDNYHVPNQLALFQYLAKEKFDFQELIADGLSIDVNTLQTNPYL